MYSPDVSCSQLLLLAHHELFEEINVDVVVRGQVDPDVGGQEVVDLPFTPVLGAELL